MNLESILGLVVAALLLVYLAYALLRGEVLKGVVSNQLSVISCQFWPLAFGLGSTGIA